MVEDSRKSVIAQQIKKLLTNKRIKQRELSNMLGLKETAVSSWVSGRRSPTLEQLILIAEKLNTTVDYLVGKTDVMDNDNTYQAVFSDTGLNDYSPANIVINPDGYYPQFDCCGYEPYINHPQDLKQFKFCPNCGRSLINTVKMRADIK